MNIKKKTMLYMKYGITATVMVVAGMIYMFQTFSSDATGSDGYDTFDAKNTGSEQSQQSEASSSSLETVEQNPMIYVYICGQIAESGVRACKEGTRVYELIELSGGMTECADITQLNLADVVKDGQKIYIPAIGEGPESSGLAGTAQEAAGTGNEKININKATQAQLMTLPGIGESRASDIIAYRTEQGSFSSIEEIKKVSGIKDAAYAKIKDLICV